MTLLNDHDQVEEPPLPRQIPDRSTWTHLTPQLTVGELALAEKLDDELPSEWTIAVQARLGNANPDVVCFHPERGFLVFEIKDWQPDTQVFKLEEKLLWARNVGSEKWYVTAEPVSQVINYRRIIGELFSSLSDTEFMITSVAVMTNYSEQDPLITKLKRLVPAQLTNEITAPHMLVVGQESLARPISEWIGMVTGVSRAKVEGFRRNKMLPARTRLHATWLLRIPELAQQRDEPLPLDPYKKRFVSNENKQTKRRVSGAVGSGKTTLLAGCAAKAVSEGKRVLVLSYNITLRHWIQLQIKRGAPDGISYADFSLKVKQQVELDYLHEWLETMCTQSGHYFAFKHLFTQSTEYPKDEILLNFCSPILDQIRTKTNGLYDLILVDEFQNFNPKWLPLIEKTMKTNGEIVVFRDPTQNVYAQDQSKVDVSMIGYRGQWNRLKDCHRFPSQLIPMLSDFYDRFKLEGLDTERPIREQQSFEDKIDLVWVKCDYEKLPEFGAQLIQEGLSEGHAAADCVFLTRYHADGLQALKLLDPVAMHEVPGFVHIFHKDKEHQRHLKKAFWPLRGEVKMCTIHSYQGWEASYVVLCISPFEDNRAQQNDSMSKETYVRLIYTGLSRIRKSMNGSKVVVVNSERRLDSFFEEHFREITSQVL